MPRAAQVVVVASLMTATAAVTYALSHTTTTPTQSPPSTAAPTYTPAQQQAAKDAVCSAFGASTRGQSEMGSMIDESGAQNVRLVVRTLGSVAAIQNAVVPATPQELTRSAQRYVDAQLDLVNATMAYVAPAPIGPVNDSTSAANDATHALADACGIPR